MIINSLTSRSSALQNSLPRRKFSSLEPIAIAKSLSNTAYKGPMETVAYRAKQFRKKHGFSPTGFPLQELHDILGHALLGKPDAKHLGEINALINQRAAISFLRSGNGKTGSLAQLLKPFSQNGKDPFDAISETIISAGAKRASGMAENHQAVLAGFLELAKSRLEQLNGNCQLEMAKRIAPLINWKIDLSKIDPADIRQPQISQLVEVLNEIKVPVSWH